VIKDYLNGNIHFLKNVTNWQEAIRLSAEPLLSADIIEPRYVDAMIQNVTDNGNYIIILPEIAMPHARHEYGAKGTGISFLKIANPTLFPRGVPVSIFFALSSETNDGHLDILADLSEVLSDPEKVDKLKQAESEEDVLKIFTEN